MGNELYERITMAVFRMGVDNAGEILFLNSEMIFASSGWSQ